MSREKKKKHTLAVKIVSAILLAGALEAGGPRQVQAVFQEEEAVHIQPDEIEEATLIIGTHLISLGALTDEIYEIALESASDSNQMHRYYKSELAEGAWFDITEASSVKDITGEGKPVEKSAIEALFLTHHTKADGVTYDLRTGKAVGIFQITDPYDMENAKETEALKQQYDIIKEKKDKTDTETLCLEEIEKFFEMEWLWGSEEEQLSSSTAEQEAVFLKLQQLYETLSGEEKEIKAAVLKVLKSADAKRRLEVLKAAAEEINALLETLQGMNEDVSSSPFQTNSDLVQGASDSKQAIEESILEYEAEVIEEGDTVISKKEAQLAQDMENSALSQDMENCRKLAKEQMMLEAILSNQPKDAKEEAKYLQETLVPEAQKALEEALTGGVSQSYKNAEEKETAAVLQELLEEQQKTADGAGNQLEFLAECGAARMSEEEAAAFLSSLQTQLEKVQEEIPEDAFADYARQCAEQVQEGLEEKKGAYQSSQAAEALSELLAQKQKLQEEKLSALDDNDLSGAKKAEEELEALNDKIQAQEKAAAGTKEELSQEESAIENALETGKEITKAAKESIKAGSTEQTEEAIAGAAALAAASPQAAANALEEIYQALSAKANLDSEEAEKEELEALMELTEEETAAIAPGLNSRVTQEAVEAAVFETVQGEPEQLAEEEQAALLYALAEEGQKQGAAAEKAGILAEECYSQGNPYVFLQYSDQWEAYAPLKNLAEVLHYRYVFNNSRKQVTLSAKTNYYTFKAFDAFYTKGEEEKALKEAAGYQKDIYLESSDLEELFSCSVIYIPDSDYGVLLTPDLKEAEEEYLNGLSARLGG